MARVQRKLRTRCTWEPGRWESGADRMHTRSTRSPHFPRCRTAGGGRGQRARGVGEAKARSRLVAIRMALCCFARAPAAAAPPGKLQRHETRGKAGMGNCIGGARGARPEPARTFGSVASAPNDPSPAASRRSESSGSPLGSRAASPASPELGGLSPLPRSPSAASTASPGPRASNPCPVLPAPASSDSGNSCRCSQTCRRPARAPTIPPSRPWTPSCSRS